MPNSIQLKNIKGEDIFPVVIKEGLQSINKQVTIPTGSTVASVTLDNDKYNIIDTINSDVTELDIHIPKSLTKVQECDFEFGVGADSVLSTLKAFATGRQIPVKAPSVFVSNKMYQGTSLNNVITITEFDSYPIIITNIEATNETSSSIDIVVTGTMGSDPLPNNLEYTLSLSLDGVITNIDAVGTTTTLTENQYTAYKNANTVSADIIIDYTNYQEFVIKEPQVNPLNLPANTLRVRYAQGTKPGTKFKTPTLVDQENNIYDLTYDNNGDWTNLFQFEKDKVEEILGINSENITNMNSAFSRLSISKIPLFDTSSVTNMRSMFSGCSNLETVPSFDTSSVTDMSWMFQNCVKLVTVPTFNTTNVTNMNSMFQGCESLTTVPLFDTANVTNMDNLFRDCFALTSIPLFNTSSVTSMSYMCKDCFSVASGALALYEQASIQSPVPTHDKYTFSNCGVDTITGNDDLSKIPTEWGGNYDTTVLPAHTIRVKYKSGTVPNSTKINNEATKTQISDTDNIWDITLNSSDWSELFYGELNLQKVYKADTSHVTNMSKLFYQTNLEVLPAIDTSKVTDMSEMFYQDQHLYHLPSSFDTSNVTNMDSMFYQCNSLQMVPLFDTTNVTNMSHTFSNCKRLVTVPLFNTSNVTDMSGMFVDCTALKNVPVFDTSKVTTMRYMFSNSSVETVPLFDTSNVTDMYGMFQGCLELVNVPLFNTSKVTDMGYMFDMVQDQYSDWSRAKLESIPLFDTSSVTGMLAMFRNCGRLKKIPVFANVSKVKDVSYMFGECRSVETGILSLYNKLSALGINNHTYTFYNCGLLSQSGQAELAQIPDDWKGY